MNRKILSAICDTGILPVINLPDPEQAEALAGALSAGEISVLEITLRSECSLEVIRRIRKARPEMIVGAGTVLSPSQAEEALSAGADYIVIPGFNLKTVEYCRSRNVPVIPGCVTASELGTGLDCGLEIFKFFPAESCGGLSALKLLHGPYPKCRFIPTGGMTMENIGDYLSCGFVAACGGSFMAGSAEIAAGRWEQITANCRRCMDISLGFELAHVGINHADMATAMAAAVRTGERFRMPVRQGRRSVFSGTAVEHMKSPFHGLNGHIGFHVRSVERAWAWYVSHGVEIREDSLLRGPDGSMQSFYLKEEIGGFAVHVMKGC